MEYCAVRGIFDQSLSSTKQTFDIHQDVSRGLVIAALHEAYIGGNRTGTGPAYEILDLRAKALIPYILQGLEGLESPSSKDIKCALEAAFQRVDEEVCTRAKELEFDCQSLDLETKLNSFVLVVHDGFVYVAGAADGWIFLARDSKPKYLTSSNHHISRNLGITKERICTKTPDPGLFYFHQERLQAADAFLVMASCALWSYVCYDHFLLPILQSRIDAVGLIDACKSMVGPYRAGNKNLIVITLQPGAHEPKSHIQPVDEKLLSTKHYDDRRKRDVDNPLRYLLPYVDGKKQEPVPVTSSLYFVFNRMPELCSEDEIEMECSTNLELSQLSRQCPWYTHANF